MEPISILTGTLGAKFIEQAISFLWSEAGKILDRYHKRRDASTHAVSATIDDPAPPELNLPAKRTIDFDKVTEREEALLDARDKLNRYREGYRAVSIDDQPLMAALQQILDALGEIYHVPVSPLVVRTVQEIGEVATSGRVVGIEAEGVSDGRLESVQKVERVKGNVTGVVKK